MTTDTAVTVVGRCAWCGQLVHAHAALWMPVEQATTASEPVLWHRTAGDCASRPLPTRSVRVPR